MFAYNGRVGRDIDGNYFGNELNDTLVERYRFLGKHVTFLVRQIMVDKDAAKKMMPFKSIGFSVVGLKDFNGIGGYLRNLRENKRIIEKEVKSCDIIVARLPSAIGRMAIDYAIKYKKSYLVEVVGCPWDALWNHSFSGKLVAPWAYLQMKRYVARAPFVSYVTSDFLQGRYPNRRINAAISDVLITENPLNALQPPRIAKLSAFNRGNSIVLGTLAGVDVSYKGQDTVIRAMAVLNKKGFKFQYKMAGKGTGYRLKMLARELGVENNIKIIGQIPHHSVFEFIDSLDIYIQPSKQEGLPRALVEAMSMGCPCIGAKTGGIPELIDDGMIFEKGDVAGLVRIIEHLDSKQLEQNAKVNLLKSKSFLPSELEKKRKAFYLKFLQLLP